MDSPEQFHRPYLARNAAIAGSILRGDGERAERDLLAYLADAERQILAAYDVPALVVSR